MSKYDTDTRRQALAETLSLLKHLVIEPECLDLDDAQTLGRGGYGDVQVVSMQTKDGSRQQVAVKTMFPSEDDEIRMALRFAREVKAWAQLNHPNVLSLLGFYMQLEDPQWLYCVSTFLEQGDVSAYLGQNRDTNEFLRFQWVHDITRGLKYLHTLRPSFVVHGDLKGENVLLCGPDLRAVLCDFGLSRIAGGSSETGLTTSDDFKGTLAWCSPELLTSNAPRTRGSDMWAWALLVLFIMTGTRPFHAETNVVTLLRRITTGEPPRASEYPSFLFDYHLWRTLEICLSADPNDRYGAIVCLNSVMSVYIPYRLIPCNGDIPFNSQKQKIVLVWSFDTSSAPTEFLGNGRNIIVRYRSRSFNTIVAYDLETGRQFWSHQIGVFSDTDILQLAVSEDTSTIAFASDDSTSVKVLCIERGTTRTASFAYPIDFRIRDILFVGSDLLVLGATTVIRIVSATTPFGKIFRILQLSPKEQMEFSGKVVVSPDLLRVAVITRYPTNSCRIYLLVLEQASRPELYPATDNRPLYQTGIDLPIHSRMLWLSDTIIALIGHPRTTYLYDIAHLPQVRSWELPFNNPFYIGDRPVSQRQTTSTLVSLGRLFHLEDIIEGVEQQPLGGQLSINHQWLTDGDSHSYYPVDTGIVRSNGIIRLEHYRDWGIDQDTLEKNRVFLGRITPNR